MLRCLGERLSRYFFCSTTNHLVPAVCPYKLSESFTGIRTKDHQVAAEGPGPRLGCILRMYSSVQIPPPARCKLATGHFPKTTVTDGILMHSLFIFPPHTIEPFQRRRYIKGGSQNFQCGKIGSAERGSGGRSIGRL